ncbi:LAQU0S16e02762g1_1 [Lachancea quebecensis]|uniref:LAQU0S16e02762g1_1 n=1 Tax=Lachancea quebecensis TaxID=1654605 RepID=A0A0P1KW28_9SACH|nr:LAQU0S16e02762g1_1 [Lachancea quebecensis]
MNELDEGSFIPSSLLDSDDDADELPQDWSHIAKLSRGQVVVPKRGEKDYEPDGTNAQEMLLHKAKTAMFDSLSDASRGSVVKNLIKAYYVPDLHKACVPHPKGSFMHTMGKVDRNGSCWLSFFEFVYLAERGTITPYYKRKERDDHNLDPLLGIQDLYMLFKSQKESDEFAVYAHLKRLGFIVMQSSQNSAGASSVEQEKDSAVQKLRLRFCQTFESLSGSVSNPFNLPFYHPLQCHLTRYCTSAQIYESLNKLIPYIAAPKTQEELQKDMCTKNDSAGKWEFSFDVWKPQSNFKKKTPGLPDFQVVVFNKNSQKENFPTYHEMRGLLKMLRCKMDFLSGQANEQPNPTKTEEAKGGAKKKSKANKKYPPHIEQQRRIKRGYRSFVLATMDDGLVSFIKITETDFGSENVWFKPNNAPVRKEKGKPKGSKFNGEVIESR